MQPNLHELQCCGIVYGTKEYAWTQSTLADNGILLEAFTNLAPRYDQVMDRELRELWGISYPEFVQRLVDSIQLQGSQLVLDMATGTASIPLAMTPRLVSGTNVIGLDITPAMLKAGTENLRHNGGEKVRLVCASAVSAPFAEYAFDVVTCALATHHMEVSQVLAEIDRVLKEGGQLYLADVHAPSIWRSPLVSLLIQAATWLYGLAFHSARARAEATAVPNLRTAAEWQHMLWASGFRAIEIIATFPPRRPWYPGAILLRATKGSLPEPAGVHFSARS